MALDDRSSSLRQQVLVPNAGWLGEGVTILADVLGLWDVFVLMVFFVVFWVVIRTTSCEVSFMLGMLFDLGIPLQYQNDQGIARMHERHLQGYWPIFGLGSIVEVAGYLFFHPDLFTLVVCVKTTGCLALWLSRKSDGSKIALRGGGSGGGSGHSGHIPPINGWDGRPIPPLRDKDFPDAEAQLLATGYDPLIVEGMIHALRRTNEKDKGRNMREWTRVGLNDPARMESRRQKYTERALRVRQERLAKALRGESGSGIPREAIVGLGRPSGGQPAQTRRDTGGRGAHRPPPIAVSRPHDGSWAHGGRPMRMTKEQVNQITEKIAQSLKKQHGRSEAKNIAKARVEQLMQINDPRELQKALGSMGIIVQNPSTLTLLENYDPEEIRLRAKKLMYPHAKHGLEMPRQIADMMMTNMLSQRSVSEADRLFESWMAIRSLDPQRRLAEKRRIMDRFGDNIYLAEDDLPGNIYGPERLVQPWDIPDW